MSVQPPLPSPACWCLPACREVATVALAELTDAHVLAAEARGQVLVVRGAAPQLDLGAFWLGVLRCWGGSAVRYAANGAAGRADPGLVFENSLAGTLVRPARGSLLLGPRIAHTLLGRVRQTADAYSARVFRSVCGWP